MNGERLFRLIIITIAVFVVAGSALNAQAEDDLSREYLVKAAFLYNFAKFVEWPAKAFADDQTPITLWILGRDPFGVALESIKGKTISSRQLVIKRFARIEDLEKCHILFISRSEKEHLGTIFAQLGNWQVLTVGDMKNFAKVGGIINFITLGGKVRFQINVDAAERTGLKISSKLLKLAKIIRDKGKGKEN